MTEQRYVVAGAGKEVGRSRKEKREAPLGVAEMRTGAVVVTSQVCGMTTAHTDFTCIQLFLYSNHTSMKL